MDWIGKLPGATGFYGYRSESVQPTIVFVEVPDGPIGHVLAYFAKSSVGVQASTLDGEFCGPITLPE